VPTAAIRFDCALLKSSFERWRADAVPVAEKPALHTLGATSATRTARQLQPPPLL
jgi:hypothetical protein